MKTPRLVSNSIASLGFAVVCLALPGFAQAAPDVSQPVTTPAAAAAAAPSLPYGVTEVVKMYQGGINKDVILGYVQSTALPFHLTADGIIYLNHMGMPQDVISALIHRDGQLHEQAALAYQQQSQNLQEQNYQQQSMANPPGSESNPQLLTGAGNQVVTPATPPPPVYGDGTVYPDYSGYPYDYGAYYWPPVVVGGWGGYYGRGWGGWGRGFGPGFGHFGGGFGHGGFRAGGVGGFGGHGGGGFGGHGGGGHGGGHR